MPGPNFSINQGETKNVLLTPLAPDGSAGGLGTPVPHVSFVSGVSVTVLDGSISSDGLIEPVQAGNTSGVAQMKARGFQPGGQPFDTPFTLTVQPQPADHFGIDVVTP